MRSFLRAGLALGILAAACKDSTAPELANPAALAAELAAANEPFETAVFQSFGALGDLSSVPAPAPAGAVLLAIRPVQLETGSALGVRSVATAEQLRALVPQLSPAARQDTIIPDTLVGTWVWDETGNTYVKSTTRTVGPDTVRIVLYVIDELTEMPVEPVDEVGYLDVVDKEPAGPGYAFDVTVKDSAGTVTYADYDVTVTPSTGSFTASAVGFISNGLQSPAERTLEFNLAFSATGTETSGTVSADAVLNLNNPSITLEQHDDVTFEGTTATFTRDFRFHRPGEVITLVGTVTIEQLGPDSFRITLDIAVRVNGGTYATIAGTITITSGAVTEQNVTITGPGRNQGQLLADLTLAGDALFGAIDALFNPVESLSP